VNKELKKGYHIGAIKLKSNCAWKIKETTDTHDSQVVLCLEQKLVVNHKSRLERQWDYGYPICPLAD
jgi:hypothetical protein